jgi:hypothetical protein
MFCVSVCVCLCVCVSVCVCVCVCVCLCVCVLDEAHALHYVWMSGKQSASPLLENRVTWSAWLHLRRRLGANRRLLGLVKPPSRRGMRRLDTTRTCQRAVTKEGQDPPSICGTLPSSPQRPILQVAILARQSRALHVPEEREILDRDRCHTH